MAYELASAGLGVCVLERGRAYPPGSFPRSPREVARNFWQPDEGLLGLFDLWAFRHSEALVASGLGGGSLIYANVLLRKPEEWFFDRDRNGVLRPWPVGRADLEPHYDAVEAMLGATPYPFGQAPYDQTAKTRAMERAAAGLGLDWTLPHLAVAFAPGVCVADRRRHAKSPRSPA